MRPDDTVTITAVEFHRNPGRYQDVALTRPVTLTKNGRERTDLLSAEEYQRLKRRDRRALAAEELSAAQLSVVRAATVPSEYGHLDAELAD